jgi:hypothetical protein
MPIHLYSFKALWFSMTDWAVFLLLAAIMFAFIGAIVAMISLFPPWLASYATNSAWMHKIVLFAGWGFTLAAVIVVIRLGLWTWKMIRMALRGEFSRSNKVPSIKVSDLSPHAQRYLDRVSAARGGRLRPGHR